MILCSNVNENIIIISNIGIKCIIINAMLLILLCIVM